MVFTEGAVVPGLGFPLLLIYQYIALQAQSTVTVSFDRLAH